MVGGVWVVGIPMSRYQVKYWGIMYGVESTRFGKVRQRGTGQDSLCGRKRDDCVGRFRVCDVDCRLTRQHNQGRAYWLFKQGETVPEGEKNVLPRNPEKGKTNRVGVAQKFRRYENKSMS